MLSIKHLFLLASNLSFTVTLVLNAFYTEKYFENIFCASSAKTLNATFSTLTSCASLCKENNGCIGFFYNSYNYNCYAVDKVLTSTTGCITQNHTRYYSDRRQVDSSWYNMTGEDMSQIGDDGEAGVCNAKPLHEYTNGDNILYPGCGAHSCCKLKGCYTGYHRDTYNGTWNRSKYGILCQRWDSHTPHIHTNTDPDSYPVDSSIYAAHNYCRDPDYTGALWCYTIDKDRRWEICDIPSCDL